MDSENVETAQAGPSASSDSEGEKEKKSEQQQQQQGGPLSPNTLKCAAADCLNSWICYLQIMNSMCAAGLHLSQSLSNLSQLQNVAMSSQLVHAWEELSRATVSASNAVKTHIAAAMQDMSIGETFTEEDAQRQMEHNQQIVAENLLTFLNLHYQFSIAGCECFGPMAMCPSCNTTPGGMHNPECSMGLMQQLFARLYQQESHSQMSSPRPEDQPLVEPRGSSPYQEPQPQHRGTSPIHSLEGLKGPFPTPGPLHTMKMPFPGRGSRSPLHFPLFPLNCQRRWSEAAAPTEPGGDGEGAEGPMRRWSMPWDCAWLEGQQSTQRYFPSKLVVPQERSRSTTPEAVPPIPPGTISSGDGLAEAIQLLSCRPTRQSIPQTALPGHPLPGFVPPWAESHEERMHRRMYPGPASQRGNWQSIDVPHASGHYDIFPITSRKSSSSTDSSSCLSIHSRSTTSSSERGSCSEASGPEAIRLHQNLYSMWSGSEHLPFIKLPESQEPQDDSDTDDPPTEKSGGASPYPKPT